MATMILSTVGGFLGPVGGVLGGILGGFIDQWLFGQFTDPIKGPRLEELRVPTFDEGAPAPWVLGPENRIAGQVIWVSKPREVKNNSGGKGGGGGSKTESYDYFCDVAVAFARQATSGSKPVKRIWANGTIVYEADTGFNQTSSVIAITAETEKKNLRDSCKNKAINEFITYTHSGVGVADFFKNIKTGQMVTITGASNAANNGTYKVLSVTLKVGGVEGKTSMKVLKCEHKWKESNCTETTSPACNAGVTESAGASITISQEGLDEFNKGLISSVTQYNGAASQTVDPTMEAEEGTGKVPAYRGTTYVLLKKLKVNHWGGTLPGFEGLVAESTSKNVSAAIGEILTRNARVTSSDYDVSGVTGTLLGLAVVGPKPPIEALRALMLVYDIDVQTRGVIESGVFKHKLFFFNRESATEITISDVDRGAKAAGSERDEELIKLSLTDPASLPTEVIVGFIDKTNEWQPGSRTYRRAVSTIENQTRVSLPMTLTPSNALALAKKMAWAIRINERVKVEVTLPPTSIEIGEADIIVVNDAAGSSIKGRVSRIDRGANHLLKIEALEELVAVYGDPVETIPGA